MRRCNPLLFPALCLCLSFTACPGSSDPDMEMSIPSDMSMMTQHPDLSHKSGDMTVPPPDMSHQDLAPVDMAASGIQTACNSYAATYCSRLQGCSAYEMQITYGDSNSCAQRVAKLCVNRGGASGTSWTAANIATCTTSTATATCTTVLSPNGPCLPLAGALNNGAACGDHSQCKSAFCYQASGPSTCGVCTAAAAVGGACSTTLFCAVGLSCINSVCVQPLADGATCAAMTGGAMTVPCQLTSYCNVATGMTSGMCAPQIGLNGTCANNPLMPQPCSLTQGLTCNSSNKCAQIAVAAAGAACGLVGTTVTTCAASGGCVNSICAAAVADNGACTGSPPCQSGASCSNGTCLVLDPSTCH